MSDQLDLFATPTPAPAAAPVRQCPPRRERGARSHGGNPVVAQEILAEIQHGRYGLLDDTDRVVVFEEPDRVRLALDEDAVTHLLTVGCVERGPVRDTVSAHHGAIIRPVQPLRLTRRGRTLLARWAAYTPFGER